MTASARVMREGWNEAALFWAPEFGGIELMRAAFGSHRFPVHTHETFAVAIHTRGLARSWYRGRNWVIPAGTVAVYPPGEVHTGEPVGELGWCYRMFYLPADLMEALGWRAGYVPVNGPTGPVIHDQLLCCRLLMAHRVFEISRSALHRESALVEALGLLVSRVALRPPDPAPESHRAVRQIMQYFEVYYADAVRLDDLSQTSGLSPFHLLRVFRQATGLTPHAYLNQLRVGRARELLRGGHAPADAALRTGFADQSHLTRHFRRLVGVTPGQYARGVASLPRLSSA
jgi:AraC-like DNA-binding protein